MSKLYDYLIYTDGSCEPNPGPGGYGFVVIDCKTNEEHTSSGRFSSTTNNRMELMAVIEGIKHVTGRFQRTSICVYSDSQYVVNGASYWIYKWIMNGWKKNTVKNRDLWEELYTLITYCPIDFKWVKAHNGDKYNEMADVLASGEKAIEVVPFQGKENKVQKAERFADHFMKEVLPKHGYRVQDRLMQLFLLYVKELNETTE